jgi:predicted ATPase
MDPQLKRKRTLDVLKRMVLSESIKQSVVIIFEDLHWIDGQTQAFLDLLADSLPIARILLLVNNRPEYRHEWGNKTYYSQLRLDALDSRSARELLGSLLGDGAELDQLKRMVTERTGGNPFFIEEILQALFDAGALVRNGRAKITRPLSQVRLPPTVQGILASRIDRLPGDHKQLLQTLALLGKESTIGLIRQISSMTETQLERTLAALRAAEFIYEQPATAGVEYTFKHALTQEVAYNSLLSERRRHLHEQAAEALETLSAANLPDQYDNLARHYGLSGNVSQAVKYLRLAAQQSASRGAYAEGVSQLNQALELLQTQAPEPERDRSEIGLRLDLALCQKFSGVLGTPGSIENLERAASLCQRVSDDITRFNILEGLADHYSSHSEIRKSRDVSQEMLEIATRTHNDDFAARAHWLLGGSLFAENLTAASEHFEVACKLSGDAEPSPGSLGWNLPSRARILSALALWPLGFPQRAMARAAEALAIERELKAAPTSLVCRSSG